MNEWKKHYTIIQNLRSAIAFYHLSIYKTVPSLKVLEYINSLEYDALVKVKMFYRAKWFKSMEVTKC